jgi:hypothetical protein
MCRSVRHFRHHPFMDLSRLVGTFGTDRDIRSSSVDPSAEALAVVLGGVALGEGLLRFHTVEGSQAWSLEVGSAFPAFASRIKCFAVDWLGRRKPRLPWLSPSTHSGVRPPATPAPSGCTSALGIASHSSLAAPTICATSSRPTWRSTGTSRVSCWSKLAASHPNLCAVRHASSLVAGSVVGRSAHRGRDVRPAQ